MKIGIVGLGSMGAMLLRAFVRSGRVAQSDLWVSNRSSLKIEEVACQYPRVHAGGITALAQNSDLIFLCTKAAGITSVMHGMDGLLRSDQLLIVLANVIPIAWLESRVPCRVAKLIPSITQEIDAGIALLAYGERVTTEDRGRIEQLISPIARPVVLPEPLVRIAADITSCGPALLAYMLESMAQEAVRHNPALSLEAARSLVWQTASAAVKLSSPDELGAEELMRRVAVPGGNTALGLQILSRNLPETWSLVYAGIENKEKEAREAFMI